MKVMMRSILIVAMVLLLAGLQVGCTSKYKLAAHAPDWVNRGSGAFKDAGSAAFYGVGAVEGVSSQSLAVEAANQRARADIANQLDTYVRNLYHDYQASTAVLPGKQAPAEQNLELTLETITEISVHGVRIVDHWKDPKTNTIYSLAKLDLAEVKSSLPQMTGVDPELRQYIRNNADKAFDAIRSEPKEPKGK